MSTPVSSPARGPARPGCTADRKLLRGPSDHHLGLFVLIPIVAFLLSILALRTLIVQPFVVAPPPVRNTVLPYSGPLSEAVIGCDTPSADTTYDTPRDYAYKPPRDYAYILPGSACTSIAPVELPDELHPSGLVNFPRVAPPRASLDSATGILRLSGGDTQDALRLTIGESGILLTAEGTFARPVVPLSSFASGILHEVVVEGPISLLITDFSSPTGLTLSSEGPVILAAPLTLNGELSVEAPQLTVAGPLNTAGLEFAVSGVLDFAAGSHLVARGSANVRADTLIVAGDLVASQITTQARTVLHSGTFTANDITVRFSESYQGTVAARFDALGETGGAVLLDGGSRGSLFSSGTIDATGVTGPGGQVDLFGNTVVLVSAAVDVSGAEGGGRIRVGGDLQGRNPAVENASAVTLAGGTMLRADALLHGDGGRVIVWSNGLTEVTGDVSARGGLLAGNGGFVELSGKVELRSGVAPDVGAPAGKAGEVLLDPKNLTIAADGILPQFELRNPTPQSEDTFGATIVPLDQGAVVVLDVGDDAIATNAGAVYLFDGLSGALLSTLTGSKANDQVGSGGVTLLSNGNYVISSRNWDNGPVIDAGAVTWGSARGGVAGVVSPLNSLVGSTASDLVGGAVKALPNGHYVVSSSAWDNSALANVGAATWGNGNTGIVGPVSPANSLVGSKATDNVGSVTVLSNGNYVVSSIGWEGDTAADVGAATWADGSVGRVGFVTAANSLVGSATGDFSGSSIVPLSNGNYVIRNPSWNNGSVVNAGAVTWGDGTSGTVGVISATNSLVGTSANDFVGISGVFDLGNGNYVVGSNDWDNGALMGAGAITWCSGTGDTVGPVSPANSLVGSSAEDGVTRRVIALGNGNYIVHSPFWNNDPVDDAGAVTWGDGTSGVTGPISAANSLVGTKHQERLGYDDLIVLSNGNYVVSTSSWQNNAGVAVGAVTWGDGSRGVSGTISAANSLVGTTIGDMINDVRITALANGNYVVVNPLWDNGTATNVGAVTWANGSTGLTGTISSDNSLIGFTSNDRVGEDGVIPLPNGNYVVRSPYWGNGALTYTGAVTWGSGASGIVGYVSPANSLVGSTEEDLVGYGNITVLSNSNYVVSSPYWDHGMEVDVGAVTWGNGEGGTIGLVSAANSLVGSAAGLRLGNRPVTALTNGNYVVSTDDWDNGEVLNVGAVAWGSGTGGTAGPISTSNALVGSISDDRVGFLGAMRLSDGNYVVRSQLWDNGTTGDAGAISWGNGTGGTIGPVSTANSVVNTGNSWMQEDQINGTFFVRSALNGGRIVVAFGRVAQLTYARAAAENLTITPQLIAQPLASGAALTLQASNDLTLTAPLIITNPDGPGGALILQAGRNVILGANLNTDGAPLSLVANDTLAAGVVDIQRDPGPAGVLMIPGVTIDAGGAAVLVDLRSGAGRTNADLGVAELTTITGVLTVQGAPLAPGGDAAGTTSVTGGLTLGEGLAVTLTGATTGQFDQVVVAGSVALAGPLTLGGSGYTPAIGDTLLLISNDGSDTVTGNFTGLVEGATLSFGGVELTLSYIGGDGNDVTLTRAASPNPAFTSTLPPVGTYGAGYSHTFIVSGMPAPAFSITAGVLPPGLSLNGTTGVLSGTPTQAGTFGTITVAAANGTGQPATQTITIVIAKAPLTVTAQAASKRYGAAVPTLNFITSGFLPGDTQASALTGTLVTTATATSNVGSYAITQGSLASTNYAINFTGANLAVTPALLTVTAENKVWRIGQPKPALTVFYTGFVLEETATVLNTAPAASTQATAASPLGQYDITVAGGDDTNYQFTYVTGILTITDKDIPVITWPQPTAITYGTALGTTQFNATASLNGQPVPGTFSYNPPAGAVLDAGVGQLLTVSFTPADEANTAVVSRQVQLTVNPAPLTITADDKHMVAGGVVPALTTSYAGLLNGDTAASLDTPVVLTTSATASSPAGSYPITVAGGSDANYTVTRVNGTLRVDPSVPSLVTLAGVRGKPGSSFTFEATGFASNSEVLVAVDGRLVLRLVPDEKSSLRFVLFFASNASARAYEVSVAAQLAVPQIAEMQTATTTVTIDPTAPLLSPTTPNLQSANALPTIYLPLVVR